MSLCPTCWGEGEISVCCDDLCQEVCIHGDGMIVCPECGGEGDIPDDDDNMSEDDWAAMEEYYEWLSKKAEEARP